MGRPQMAIEVGTVDYRYRIIENWAQLPDGWSFKEVAAVGVDKNDNVYAFGRGEHPMMVFDRTGKFLRSWGEGQYPPGARGAGHPGALSERRAVQPLHPHRAVAKGRNLRLRRLRQRPGPQI